MISKQYEKAQLKIVEFELDDVLTKSSVVTTTQPSTTLPGTTSGGVQIGGNGEGDITIDFSDLFGNK